MKKNILFTLSFLVIFITNAQINFEKGYFINNVGVKTQCLIKNVDWKNNPKEITYKLSLSGETIKATISNTKEFGINGFSKFIRADIDIDVSRSETSKLSLERKPNWENRTVFLKTIVEGKANLYYFEDGNLKRFFYSTVDVPIEQLIYKLYINEKKKVLENAAFKQQLLNNVKCDKISIDKIQNLNYELNNIQDYFIKYNQCFGEITEDYSQKKRSINLNLRPGISYSSLEMTSSYDGLGFPIIREFDKTIGYRFGVEVEAFLPFNKSKWSLFVEPTYQSFNSQDSYGEVKYSSIEIPIGVRYYFFLSDDIKLFINAIMLFDIPFSSSFISPNIEVHSSNTFAFGAGFKYQKFSIETRYSNKHIIIPSNNKNLSFILGYSIF